MTVSAIDIMYNGFDEKFLLDFFYNDYQNFQDYVIPDYENDLAELGDAQGVIPGFKVDCHNYFNEQLRPIAEEFCKHFDIQNQCVTHFLCIEPQHTVDWHIDGGNVVCAVNLLLEGDPCAVEFKDGKHTYKLALLDISKHHRVRNTGSSKRVLFRISFMDGTYEEIKNKCLK